MRAPIVPDAVFDTALDVMSRPFRWGDADCCTAACDVFARLHDAPDPMAPVRGRYDGAMGAGRLIARHGGMLSLAQGLARAAGLEPCDARPGAIGVGPVGDGDALMICITPGRWAAKGQDGVVIVTEYKAAWTCPAR